MRVEHRATDGALKILWQAAEGENDPEIVDFAQRLMRHAQNEAEVAYPAVILVGEYVRKRLGLR
ncbi:MAG: hypothetical protein WBM28_15890 [Burkholderiales bacterium]